MAARKAGNPAAAKTVARTQPSERSTPSIIEASTDPVRPTALVGGWQAVGRQSIAEGCLASGVTSICMKGKSGSADRIACSSSWSATSKIETFEYCPAIAPEMRPLARALQLLRAGLLLGLQRVEAGRVDVVRRAHVHADMVEHRVLLRRGRTGAACRGRGRRRGRGRWAGGCGSPRSGPARPRGPRSGCAVRNARSPRRGSRSPAKACRCAAAPSELSSRQPP